LTGIDMSEKMLALAHRKVEKLGLRGVRLLRMDGMNPRFEDGEFDRVLAAYVTSVVADPCRLVRQMKRVCRKGGYLVFLNHFVSENPILRGCERMVSPICHRIGFRTGLDLQELMKECDLEIESVSSVDFLGIWKAVRCVNP
jgi:phosphatidylethanolamine/phosphatidyl-N-methylethanolamine N-methyltransferase